MTMLSRLREKIGDTTSPPTWTDEQLQPVLGRNLADLRYLALSGVETRSGTLVEYFAYRAPCGDWQDATLYDAQYAELTPDEADLDRGVWTFDADTPGPVYLIGTLVDLSGAALETLRQWAAVVKLEFDLQSERDDLKLSQQLTGILKLIALIEAERAQWKGRSFFNRAKAATLTVETTWRPK